MASGGGYLDVTCSVAPVYSARRLNEIFLINLYFRLGSSPHFPQQNFLLKLTVAIF